LIKSTIGVKNKPKSFACLVVPNNKTMLMMTMAKTIVMAMNSASVTSQSFTILHPLPLACSSTWPALAKPSLAWRAPDVADVERCDDKKAAGPKGRRRNRGAAQTAAP